MSSKIVSRTSILRPEHAWFRQARGEWSKILGLPNGDLPAGWKYVPVDQVVPGTNLANFAPRIGVASHPGTSCHSVQDMGSFIVQLLITRSTTRGREGNPFFFDFGLTGDVQTPISLRNGFPTGGIVNVLASPSFSAYYGPLDRPDPYSEKYSANIEWSPRTNMVLDVGYMGQRAFHYPTLESGEPGTRTRSFSACLARSLSKRG